MQADQNSCRAGDHEPHAHGSISNNNNSNHHNNEDAHSVAVDNFRNVRYQNGTQFDPSVSPLQDGAAFADTAAAAVYTDSDNDGDAITTERDDMGALINNVRRGFVKRGEGGLHRPLLQDGAGRPDPSYRVNHQDPYDEEEEDEEDKEAEAAVYINRRNPRSFLRRPHLAEDEQRLLPSTDSNTYTRSTNTNPNHNNISYSNTSPNNTTTSTTNYFSRSTHSDMSQPYAKGESMKYPPLPLPDPAPSSTAPSMISQADSDDALVKKNALADAGSTITQVQGGSSPSTGASSSLGPNPPYPPPVIITMNTHDRPACNRSAIVDPPHSPNSEEKRCRICLDGDNESELGRLISPCLCKGSSRYIHLKCLEQWREMSPRKESFYRCDTCHYHYSFSRPWLAKVLDKAWFPHVATVVLMLLMIYGFGCAGRTLYDKNLWHWKEMFHHGTDIPPNNRTRFLGLDGPEYLFGLVGLAVLGLIFGCIVLTIGSAADRSSDSGSPCSCNGCYVVDCGGGGGDGDAFAIVCLAFVVIAG